MDTGNVQRDAAAAHPWVTFRLGSQVYGLPVAPIEQIVPMVTITPLPEIGEPVVGMINVRGRAVTVVDLRCLVGQARAAFLLDTPIMLARIGAHSLGLVVDEVLDVLSLPPQDLIAPAQLLPAELGEAPVIAALARFQGGLALLLNPDHLFRPEQREVLSRAAGMLAQLASEAETPSDEPGADE